MTAQTPTTEIVERSACLQLRSGSEDIWEQIYTHPFLNEVEDGTLPDNKLLHYFIQNVHYIDAAIVFTAQAAIMAHDSTTRDFCFYITDFGREEVERQREYVRSLPGGSEASWEIAPTCHAYTRHLLTLAAYGGALDLLVGLSPCQWTYDEFGGRLAPIVKHPIHAQWLGTFGSEEHHELSVRYNVIVDDLMASSTPQREADLGAVFRISSKYEWMFWEMAYTLEGWPI